MQGIFKRIISNLINDSRSSDNRNEEKSNLRYLLTGLSRWTVGSGFSSVSLRNVQMKITNGTRRTTYSLNLIRGPITVKAKRLDKSTPDWTVNRLCDLIKRFSVLYALCVLCSREDQVVHQSPCHPAKQTKIHEQDWQNTLSKHTLAQYTSLTKHNSGLSATAVLTALSIW